MIELAFILKTKHGLDTIIITLFVARLLTGLAEMKFIFSNVFGGVVVYDGGYDSLALEEMEQEPIIFRR